MNQPARGIESRIGVTTTSGTSARPPLRLLALGFAALLLGACGQGQEGGLDEGDEEVGASLQPLSACNYPFPKDIYSADMTGDGKVERIVRSAVNEFEVQVGVQCFGTQHGGGYASDQPAFVDVNGDRKADLVFRGLDNRFWVSISTGTSFKPAQNWVSHGGPYIAGQATYADLNGDLKWDLTFRGGDNRYWVSYSTGTGFTPPKLRP